MVAQAVCGDGGYGSGEVVRAGDSVVRGCCGERRGDGWRQRGDGGLRGG